MGAKEALIVRLYALQNLSNTYIYEGVKMNYLKFLFVNINGAPATPLLFSEKSAVLVKVSSPFF